MILTEPDHVSPNDYYYAKSQDGNYFLVAPDGIFYCGPVLALAFSFDPEDDAIPGTLHKHGAPQTVSAWYQEASRKYREAGLNDLANELRFIYATTWCLEDLWRMLNITGYVGVWYKKTRDVAPDTEVAAETEPAEA